VKGGVAVAARAVVLVALIVPSVFVTPGAADPVSDAKAKFAAAQETANVAAARYEDAQVRVAELEKEIDELQQQIDVREAQAAALRVAAQRRAVAAYKDAGSALEFFTIDDAPLDVARRQKLFDEANARDNAAVSRLAKVQDDLARRRTDLRARRAEQLAMLDQFRDEARRLEADLVAAQRAQAAAESAIRRAEAARAASASAPPASASPSGRATPPDAAPSGPAPVRSAAGLICPVRGPVSFVDSWHAPRPGGRLHEGVDLMAPRGTPNVAVVSGTVTMKSGSVSGNGVHLRGDNGDLYYYLHLDSYEGGARSVSQGDVIGYTGDTGDASAGAPHTHFEIHPGGGGPVNPYPAVRAVC
jgi:murein DD-endopeptidase MepM/ murein hydrolase activator NlpD